jgi:thiol-disulfide isomerase/thioredoxin
MKLFISILFLVANTTIISAKVIIKGKIVNLKVLQKECYYNEPISGYGNMVHYPKQLKFQSDSTFKIESIISSPGYIYIMLPGQQLRLYVGLNDSISITTNYKRDAPTKKYFFESIKVTGNNAEGHELFAANNIYFNCQDFLIKKLFSKKNTNVSEFFEESKKELIKFTASFDSLFAINKITENYYSAITADIKSTFAFHVFNLFDFFYMSKTKPKFNENKKDTDENSEFFTQKNSVALRQKYYEYISPFDTNILHSILGKGYYSKYYQDIFAGLIPGLNTRFDSSFNKLDSAHRYLGYMKNGFLEAQWAGIIYWEVALKSDDKYMNLNYNLFKTYFPKSGFLEPLRERLKIYLNDNSFLNANAKNEINILDAKDYPSLNALFKRKFKGKYVFVDLWASWCSPCIQELINKNALQHLLDKKIYNFYIFQ